jgi:hypothetical protein
MLTTVSREIAGDGLGWLLASIAINWIVFAIVYAVHKRRHGGQR